MLSVLILALTTAASPLVIGETFTIESKILNETRRINVYLPAGFADNKDARFPVLYMPDGGIAEDFLHVAGLEPELFNTYIAFDPSLWWNDQTLTGSAAELLKKRKSASALYIATSDENCSSPDHSKSRKTG